MGVPVAALWNPLVTIGFQGRTTALEIWSSLKASAISAPTTTQVISPISALGFGAQPPNRAPTMAITAALHQLQAAAMGPWYSAHLTNYESYPDPGSDECILYNGCTWAATVCRLKRCATRVLGCRQQYNCRALERLGLAQWQNPQLTSRRQCHTGRSLRHVCRQRLQQLLHQ